MLKFHPGGAPSVDKRDIGQELFKYSGFVGSGVACAPPDIALPCEDVF